MSESDGGGPNWPVTPLRRVTEREEPRPMDNLYEAEDRGDSRSARTMLLSALGELRRRWGLATVVALLVLGPVIAYALLAVPRYTSQGVLQVSAQGGAINPLLELTGAGTRGDVETEVEIIRRREFLLGVLHELRLNVVDPAQPTWATTDTAISLDGESPVRDRLRRARASLERFEVDPRTRGRLALSLTGLAEERVEVTIGSPESGREVYELGLGETLEDPRVTLAFASMPLDEGAALQLAALSDGELLDAARRNLKVAALGGASQATNLVSVRYTDTDRETAQAVVHAMMQRYLDKSLQWQALSASNSAEFIEQRLIEARDKLSEDEETLRAFAEREHAVQLDTQAEVTIESTARLETEKRQLQLQERVIGSVVSGMKKRKAGSANLTSNFFDDPLLAANVSALTEAETEYAVLRATLTEDHPRVRALGEQIALRRKEVNKLLRSAKRNLASRRREIDSELEKAVGSLSAYPDKELQLARHSRDVEVDQRLYSFLLEKFQEAEIMEASTTTDKRIVDSASLPHRMSFPSRPTLMLSGTLGAFLLAFCAVFLAHLLQRRLMTIEAVKKAAPYAVYGTIPAVGELKKERASKKGGAPDRVHPSVVWNDASGGAEAFRALAVSVSLTPAVPDRGRIIQITSSQPGEGKSTVISNLAIALTKTGANVLLIDLDLRKPVQHRTWRMRRSPGYADLLAQRGEPEKARSLVQQSKDWDLDVLTAGTRLPDTLGALMNGTLESVLAFWSARYDYVLVDSPPAFVADTAVVGRHVDLLLLVARPGAVERGSIRNATELVARLEARKGLVVNAVERKHAEYYYGGSYYYAQAYGSTDETAGKQEAS
ncbi:MAG: GNVR domain-containing protein [Myxococcota bacterium]